MAPDLLAPLYADYAVFNGPAETSASLMTLLLEEGTERGYLPEPAKSLFICDSAAQEEATNQAFEVEVLRFNVVPGS